MQGGEAGLVRAGLHASVSQPCSSATRATLSPLFRTMDAMRA